MNTRGRGYFYPEGIEGSLFDLTSDGHSDKRLDKAMKQLRRYVKKQRNRFSGFQSTAKLDTEDLGDFVTTAINNIGDAFADPGLNDPDKVSPLSDGYFCLNSKWIERAVLDYFAKRWRADPPRRVKEDGNPCDDWLDTYWGYVLTMGCTEGNLMALRSARDYLKGRRLLYDGGRGPGAGLHYEECETSRDPEFNPVLLYSEHSHYSVSKLAQMLEFETQLVKVDEHGRIDLDDLVVCARHILQNEHRPLAVLFNYGTTWTGALDDVGTGVKRVLGELREAKMEKRTIYQDRRPYERLGYWFHVDGALGAGYGTYARKDVDGRPLPEFDFQSGVQSIAMSGHKWPGAPWPTGIYMTRNRFMLTNDVPAYVGSLDSTLAGSRSGIAPIFLWDWLARSSDEDRRKEAQSKLELAQSALEQIREAWDPKATRAPGSIMVVFKKPSDEIVSEFSLSAAGDQVHLVCMRHVDQKLVDKLINAMTKERDKGAAVESSVAVEDLGRGGY